MKQDLGEAVKEANDILAGKRSTPDELLKLVSSLHKNRKFGLARKLLDQYSGDRRVTSDPKLRLKFAQKRALSTYKDPDLQADKKLERGLQILKEADDLGKTKDQETLGQAGAIYKRLWELTAQERHLKTSLSYYLRGYNEGVKSDYGYTAINAAFVHERIPQDGNSRIRPIVRLVDGGVHDNQGIAALLEQSCSVMLVSDASGQMEAQDFPKNSLLGVPLRANNILQARVRVSQFQDLDGRQRGGLLKGLMFVHLKKDLETMSVDWIDSQDPSIPQRLSPLTIYGVQRSVQRRLAAIRTDLDSFSEAEAYALMTDGYLMTEQALKEPDALGFPVKQESREPWKFLQIEPLIKQPGADNPLLLQLKVADKLFFKVWLLVRWLQLAAGVIVLLLLVMLGYALWGWWTKQIFSLTVGDAVLAVATTALSMAGLAIILKILNYRKTLQEVLIGLGMLSVGTLLARLHLHVFDRLFLWQGRLERLLTKPAGNV